MTSGDRRASIHQIWIERIALGAVAATYLYVMQSAFPNGDGRVYMRQIEAGALIWNPNHLYMQPLGMWAYRVTQAVGLDWTLFGTLKMLAGLSAVISVALMHAALTAVPVRPATLRIVGSMGMFFSAHFISMAVAEEFYMIQMPVLSAALVLVVRWTTTPASTRASRWLLAGLGALIAVATAISINNALLGFALGIGAAMSGPNRRIPHALCLWIPGILVGLPLILLPYMAAAPSENLLSWLTAYQGSEVNASGKLYGIEWTGTGIVVAGATLLYGFASSLFLLGDLGALGENLLRSRAPEFQPDRVMLAFSTLLFIGIVGLLATFLLWLKREARGHVIVIVSGSWIIGNLLFNFVWSDISNQFYFQLLPPLWLLLTMFAMDGAPAGEVSWRTVRWRRPVLTCVVCLLAGVNSFTVVAPRAFADTEKKRDALAALIRQGDLLVTPGWDDLVWLSGGEGVKYERILLMELALRNTEPAGSPMQQLPERIRAHIAGGHRVIVARLYDLDHEGRPWEQLAKLRWPRSRIKQLLADFDHDEIGRVDSVVLRQFRLRERAIQTESSVHHRTTFVGGPPEQ